MCLCLGCSTFSKLSLSFRHLDFFEMLRNEDELEFAKRFELVCILTIILF